MTEPPQDPSDLDVPPPYKMPPNAWELGYYHGYTAVWDQEMWNHPVHCIDYQRGWNEGAQFAILERTIDHKDQGQGI